MSCEARKCSGNSTCDRCNGTCDNGCLKGWELPDCITECRHNTFGPNCLFNCTERHCKGDNSECDVEDGNCQDGCKPGWKNTNCTEICPPGKYGYNCNMSCEERGCAGNSTCDRFNGTCDSGCLKGMELPNCITECRHNTFGPNCLFSCTDRHCKGDNSKCDVEDGNCQDVCKPGWKNANCTERCDLGNYGQTCNSSCSARHCKADNESCDHVTGLFSGLCEAGWHGGDCTLSIAQTAAPNANPGPIIGGVIGTAAVVVIVVVTVIGFVFLRRRNRAQNDTKTDEPIIPETKASTRERKRHAPNVSTYVNVELSSTNFAKSFEVSKTFASDEVPFITAGEVALVVDQGQSEVQLSDEDDEDIQDPNTYYNNVQPAVPSFSLPEEGFYVTELEGVIESIRNQPGGFQAEYVKLPSGFCHSYNDSQIPENRCKNRYAGYYPYDNNRVKLSALPNTPHFDYINASYVDAYEKPNYFIAAQAPNTGTLLDFCRMIWEQDCGQIVMLTNLVENGKHKSVPYWRDSGSMNVGYFVVVVTEVIERADYVVRKIQITHTKSKKCKTFDHYHFTSWPDHGVPKVLDLLEFFWLTRDTPPSRPGPVLVHCSAGIGRTGTYIALHILTDEINKTGRMNILEVMTTIRDQRKNMVQTKNQYECIFTTMLEVVEYGQTSMITSAYTLKYAELNGSLNMGKKTLDELAEVIASTDTSDKGLPLKNQLWVDGKNDLFVVQASSKLMNKGYLLVYTPQRTANLLWKLIMENDSLTLVTLGNKNDTDFIPSPSQSSVYGKMTVTSVTETYVSREISLRILNVEMKVRYVRIKI
ncbi:receptor-type tyrosine-protein phosphatase T-like [Gigantopelta aegis]|uniref:receptor-type tyrosine-protein phosphatase T-like n=1 Tax=Gigantopelta aegis TaxID=1735272 RepID=UPI001B88C7F8|nr:receptor-type tyrosine-protein phosphatase T-like [Gigantopelta aegis]